MASRRKQGGWSWLDLAELGVKAYGAYNAQQGSKSAANTANQASAAQERALDTQSNLALANEARSEESYDEYMDNTLPANRRALSLAMQPINPNTEAAQAGADFAQQDAVNQGTMRRNLARRGVDPTSGAAIESERLGLIDSTAGKAAAMSSARRGATDRMISRIGNTSGLFNPLIGQASNFSAQAANGQASVARSQGERADTASRAAGDASAQYGASLSDLMNDFGNWWKNRTPSASTVDGK